MPKPRILIVGAGEAGSTAAVMLRQNGWDGAILLVGAEKHPPYERPPLSKTLLRTNEVVLPTSVHGQRFAELEIDYLAGTAVHDIDRVQHRAELGDDSTVPYDKLLLTTGSKARRLQCAGGDLALTLRDFDDAVAIKRCMAPGRHLVVVGGGLIGLECAASAIEQGSHVTVVEAGSRILLRSVPAQVAAIIAERHREAGVDIRLGVTVDGIVARGSARTISLTSGERIDADCIVAGIGASPNCELATRIGLAVENGIMVDAALRTTDPNIFAAGDCAAFPHPLYSNTRVRLEAWRNAQDQAVHVSSAMLGAKGPYSAVPWFWSDQYDLHLQVVGLFDPTSRVVERDIGDRGLLTFHLDQHGRLLSAVGVGPIGKIAKDIRLAEMLIANRAAPHPDALASSDFGLKSLLAA